jgi:hypothetical protein
MEEVSDPDEWANIHYGIWICPRWKFRDMWGYDRIKVKR